MMMMFQDQDFIGMAPSAIDGISSPIAAHILDFCDDGNGGDLFAAVNAAAGASDMFTASSEDASASSSSTATAPAGDSLSPLPSLDSTLSALLEQDEPPGEDGGELLLPIDEYAFVAAVDETQAPEQQQQFGQMALPLVAATPAEHPALQAQLSSTASELMQFASGFSEECFAAALAGAGAGAAAGGFMDLDEQLCPQQAMLPTGAGETFFSKDAHAAQAGFFAAAGGGGSCTPGSMVMSMMGMDEIGEYQRMMECGGALLGSHAAADGSDMAFGNVAAAAAEMQMGGSGSPVRLPATGTEGSSLEDTSFKTVRLSNEERKEKIHRYIKKRNERNFSKKIKYACRKTLADSRPRVRGRFAKNEDYCEASRSIGSQNHEEYEQIGGVKGEDMLDSDALAHISGMSSYMYNHTVESWI